MPPARRPRPGATAAAASHSPRRQVWRLLLVVAALWLFGLAWMFHRTADSGGVGGARALRRGSAADAAAAAAADEDAFGGDDAPLAHDQDEGLGVAEAMFFAKMAMKRARDLGVAIDAPGGSEGLALWPRPQDLWAAPAHHSAKAAAAAAATFSPAMPVHYTLGPEMQARLEPAVKLLLSTFAFPAGRYSACPDATAHSHASLVLRLVQGMSWTSQRMSWQSGPAWQRAEAYRLLVDRHVVLIEATDDRGLLQGVRTFAQLIGGGTGRGNGGNGDNAGNNGGSNGANANGNAGDDDGSRTGDHGEANGDKDSDTHSSAHHPPPRRSKTQKHLPHDRCPTVARVPILIEDAPRFRHRGYLLDTAHYFYSVEKLERILLFASFFKYNVFHWHITDHQVRTSHATSTRVYTT